MSLLGRGVYSIAEAARLTRLRSGRVRGWFRDGAAAPATGPVFSSDYPAVGGDFAISFLDLVEVFVAGQIREMGVSLQYLRKVYRALEDDYGKHPFCSREIYIKEGDKKKIFTKGLDDAEGERVIEALSRQSHFDQIILPFLQRIDYDEATRLAGRWRIAEMVVLDPAINFGKPIVEGAGIATSVLASAYYANAKDARRVADWYEIAPHQVEAAVSFEDHLAA